MSDDDRPLQGEVMPPSSSRSPYPPLPGLPGERRGWLRSTLAYWLDFYSERKALESLERVYDAAADAARAAEGYKVALEGYYLASDRVDDLPLTLKKERHKRQAEAYRAELEEVRARQRLERLQNQDQADEDDPEHLAEQTKVEKAKGRLHRAREKRKTDDEKRKERMKRLSGQPMEIIETLLEMHEEHQQTVSDIADMVSAGLLSDEHAKMVKKHIDDAYRTAVEKIKSGIY